MAAAGDLRTPTACLCPSIALQHPPGGPHWVGDTHYRRSCRGREREALPVWRRRPFGSLADKRWMWAVAALRPERCSCLALAAGAAGAAAGEPLWLRPGYRVCQAAPRVGGNALYSCIHAVSPDIPHPPNPFMHTPPLSRGTPGGRLLSAVLLPPLMLDAASLARVLDGQRQSVGWCSGVGR